MPSTSAAGIVGAVVSPVTFFTDWKSKVAASLPARSRSRLAVGWSYFTVTVWPLVTAAKVRVATLPETVMAVAVAVVPLIERVKDEAAGTWFSSRSSLKTTFSGGLLGRLAP